VDRIHDSPFYPVVFGIGRQRYKVVMASIPVRPRPHRGQAQNRGGILG
jgi:hypothetical protein